MKKIIAIFLIVLTCAPAFSQTVTFNKYYIQFTDKNNSPYSVSNPSAYLSQRALQRRHNQNISINESDIPVNPSYINSVAATGAVILNPTKWLNGVTIATTDSAILQKIQKLSFVKKLTPVSIANQGKLPRKKITSNLKHNNALNERSAVLNYGSALDQIEMINGTGLHDGGFLGQGMIIASLDDGYFNAQFLNCFDSLFGTSRYLGSRDFVSPVNTNLFNLDTHGCETLSTMAAYLPGQMIGTAPKASYLLMRSENDSTENPIEMYNWASATEFADSVGADIITSSLGYSQFDYPGFNLTTHDLNGTTSPCSIAANIATSKGIIVCNSAGNEGNTSWRLITVPADADSILAVGAVDGAENYASFSGQGPSADGRVKPNVAALGVAATIIDPKSGNTTPGYGTSFSCPIIAGMTACLWQKFPTKTNKQIITAIQQSASIYTTPDSLIGYGIPNYDLASIILAINSGSNSVAQADVPFAYPNPFTDQFNLIYYNDSSLTETVKVYDIVGRMVYSKAITSTTLGFNNYNFTELADLHKGVYVMVFSNGYTHQEIKIVKL